MSEITGCIAYYISAHNINCKYFQLIMWKKKNICDLKCVPIKDFWIFQDFWNDRWNISANNNLTVGVKNKALRHKVGKKFMCMSWVRQMQRGRPHLHLLSFTNFLVVVGWRRQPHVTEGQLSLWLPAVVETKHLSTYRQSQVAKWNAVGWSSSKSRHTRTVMVWVHITHSLLCSTFTDIITIKVLKVH